MSATENKNETTSQTRRMEAAMTASFFCGESKFAEDNQKMIANEIPNYKIKSVGVKRNIDEVASEPNKTWSRFELGKRTVLPPSAYKKYCESVQRDWKIPVMFTAPDGSKVFKVLEQYDNELRWTCNPDQNLEGEGYF
eukprot:2265825-Prymnesium_polylepis.1